MTPLVSAGLLALGACSGDGGSSSKTVPADADVVVRAVDGNVWDQGEYTATAVDGKVKIYAVNDTALPHNLYVFEGDLTDYDTGIGDGIHLLERGSDGALVLELAPGEYHLVCSLPGHNNMNSTLIVN